VSSCLIFHCSPDPLPLMGGEVEEAKCLWIGFRTCFLAVDLSRRIASKGVQADIPPVRVCSSPDDLPTSSRAVPNLWSRSGSILNKG